ncbi:peptidoglycan editing factor PgeF [Paracidobacterium acidisoli]|uniref:Purine nucleoside phosphorylase n=1 Tax=Paracidobacterium acidisoli TaxID=2303751 RepID=A0A372IUL5_9BACT|nr:peptidoglycan editing factor PgeF [Paracidobacterium acidisoli]MBT9330080.1 peptidoglycan editing factor PgeF [Paracidobacterium acidisoli]
MPTPAASETDPSSGLPDLSLADLSRIDNLLTQAGLRRSPRKHASLQPDRAPSVSAAQASPTRPDEDAPSQELHAIPAALDVLQVPAWREIGWLRHGFSTRTGGVSTAYTPGQERGELNLGYTASDPPENVRENRRCFVEAVTGGPALSSSAASPVSSMVTLRQIHSRLVRVVGREDCAGTARWKADGIMTNQPGVLLAIQTADCIPVLVADIKQRAVAAFHAGWRGTWKRIVEAGVGRMRMEFGSRPEDLVAGIGPGIGPCCYAVGEEVRDAFESQFVYAAELFSEVSDSDPIREKYPLLFLTARAPGHSHLGPSLHLDLIEANRRQLLDAGLSAAAISVTGECTSCRNDRYFSYRAERGFTGRMLSVIGIA